MYRSPKQETPVVFDLSADYKGRCLNRKLLSGPDLTNQIVGVLLRFREEKIAVMGDIEAMLHQVIVPKDQCSFLKFLWWDDTDPEKEIIDYEMTAHVFGGTSSPSCSNFALRRTAKDNEQQYGKEITQILERSFYVDDLLKSFPTVNQAVMKQNNSKNYAIEEVLVSQNLSVTKKK